MPGSGVYRTIRSPSPEILITSDTTSWPRLVFRNSRQISPVGEMLATTFFVLWRVGLSLVEDRRGGREAGDADLGPMEAAEAGLCWRRDGVLVGGRERGCGSL